MNELCFLSNMTGADAAAWTQSVATILALVVSVGSLLFQNRRERLLARRAQEERTSHQVAALRETTIRINSRVKFFAEQIIGTMQSARMNMKQTPPLSTMTQQVLLRDYLERSADFDFTYLTVRAAEAVSNIRATAIHLLVWLDKRPTISTTILEVSMAGWISQAQAELDKFNESLPPGIATTMGA